ncbi:MAG: DNA polymerase ligase N-terminal domain-containing protein [Planctomycetota bacterium]|jgi:hypothetical protein
MNSDTTKNFVIQEHTTPHGVHWDFMLEMDTAPAEIKNEAVGAERIHDHPLKFLTYEGPVQYGTGQVTIADKGIYSLTKRLENSLLIDIKGKVLKGEFTLCKLKDSPFWRLQSGD